MSDDTPTVVPLTNPREIPRDRQHVIEYSGDSFEQACKDYLAKFHNLPEVVYQYQYRYFFPLTENENGGIL